jgi:hypothetical protein
MFSCTNDWAGHPKNIYRPTSQTRITAMDSIETLLVITMRPVATCRETKSDQKKIWPHYVVQSLRWSCLVIRKITTKGNVVAICAKDAHDHNHTIAKYKRSEEDLSNMALKYFN